MILYSMTATFGKLEHQTLTLKPGLNIIEAPNEWGKSTWCAFLTAMLYGIDTGSRTTKTALADKERYAPWSGSPLSGRIELNWNGRDITIERRTKGRLIFGDFKAYETESGIEVTELTAANCGQVLLGVEKSVFSRAGFLKFSDLPVTQDDSLRRRLNALVTTGDESGAGDRLAQKLKELKNKCRYNRSGLLPQAESQRDDLQRKLNERSELNFQIEKTKNRQLQLQDMIRQLENHKDALVYEESRAAAQQVAQANRARDEAARQQEALQEACSSLPSRSRICEDLSAAQALQAQWRSLQDAVSALPEKPEPPDIPAHYAGLSDPVQTAREDHRRQADLEAGRKKFQKLFHITLWFAIFILGALLAAAFVLNTSELALIGGIVAVCTGIALLLTGYFRTKKFRAEMDVLYDRHPGLRPDLWIPDAEAYATRQQTYRDALALCNAREADSRSRLQALREQISQLVGTVPLTEAMDHWRTQLALWDQLEDIRQTHLQAQEHASVLMAVAKPAPPPQFPDTLTATMQETESLLVRASGELQQNQLRLGQLQGQAESLGQEAQLQAQLREVNQRIAQLEDTYQALELAQRALSMASNELQRRFAPRISKRAQALFSALTGGRYQRITLGEDLSLSTAADGEDTLHALQWRSDGTADQLYLALRLAVAEELTPEAPLVLDDALVRFDDTRLKSAMEILAETARNKQVLLFTCQSREKNLQNLP